MRQEQPQLKGLQVVIYSSTHKERVMAPKKKEERTLSASLTKNTSVEKGGAWLLLIEDSLGRTYSAWSNPSAAKRYLKAYVLENTQRKSIKMEVKATDSKEKPTHLTGSIVWKIDAE